MWIGIEIEFTISIGDKSKPAKLDQVLGMGGRDHFSLVIDEQHNGMLFTNSEGWCGPDYYQWGENKYQLTRDDLSVLADKIEEARSLERVNLALSAAFGDKTREFILFEVSPDSFVVHMQKNGTFLYVGRFCAHGAKFSFGSWEYICGDDIGVLRELIEEARTQPSQSPGQCPPRA